MTTNGRLRLLALRDQTDAHAADMARQRERFAALAAREATRAVSAFNLFQTPVAIADLMASAAVPQDGERWLEPSAGLGRLYRAIRYRSSAHVTLVEQAPQCAAELYRETQADQQCSLVQDDFLRCDAERLGGLFDGILANPPFTRGADIRHIQKMLSLLRPNGRLIALCYNGVKQNRILKPLADEWTVLPEGAFRSEGTTASVVMLKIHGRYYDTKSN